MLTSWKRRGNFQFIYVCVMCVKREIKMDCLRNRIGNIYIIDDYEGGEIKKKIKEKECVK